MTTVLSFPECHVVGITQYLAFSEWLLSFACSAFEGHLGCFQIWAVINKGAIGILCLSDDTKNPRPLNNCLLLTFPRDRDTACHSGPLRERTWIRHMAGGRKGKSRARQLYLGLGNLNNSRELLEIGVVLGCLIVGLRAITVCTVVQ